MAAFCFMPRGLPLLEITLVFVRLDHVALTDLRISASFRVTSRRISRTTSVNGQKWFLNYSTRCHGSANTSCATSVPDCVYTVVVQWLLAPCFASYTVGGET